MKNWIPACGIGLVVLSAAACGSTTTHTTDVTKTVAGPEVTKTVAGPEVTKTVAGPEVTKTVAGPAVTVTKPGPTVTVTAQPPVLMSKTFSGSGQWNSPEFTLACTTPAVTVTYSFSDNTLGNGADNFIADLQSPGGDDQSIANEIAMSGGATTTLYPNTSAGGNQYYLSVQADGPWQFNLSETCA